MTMGTSLFRGLLLPLLCVAAMVGCAGREPRPPATAPATQDPAMTTPDSDMPAAALVPIEATVLRDFLPKAIRGWKQVAEYVRLPTRPAFAEHSATSAHYRKGTHVIVLTISDNREHGIATGQVPFDAPPPPLVDERGTFTWLKRDGRWWFQREFAEPYEGTVVERFNYRNVMPEEAEPATPGLARSMMVALANGIVVLATAPADADLAMVMKIMEAVDLDRLEALPRPARGAGGAP
jgi:hypothetical protein